YCADCVPSLLPIFEPEPEIVPEKPVENDQNIAIIKVLEELQQVI
ncbi:9522_t:CDS:1, partial [Gigaspora margarita]